MSNELKLGQLLDGSQERDAIHVAIAPVFAHDKLAPGQHIGFYLEKDLLVTSKAEKKIGIVDPYLKELVMPSQQFWMFLYPNTVTGMRHHWQHPSFDNLTPSEEGVMDNVSVEASKVFLKEFAEKCGMTYTNCINRIRSWIESGQVWVEHNSECARDGWYDVDKDELWKHLKIAEGLEKPEDTDWSAPFSCSC